MFKEYQYPSITDSSGKGVLRVFESDNIPFESKRVFTVLNSEVGTTRGKHAHKICNQLICCVSGGIRLICDDGLRKEEIHMTPVSQGILVPAGIWAEQQCLETDSVIVVFCDQPYDENDYIRQYDDFMSFKGIKK
jgi:UDP-2-acetamido-3-amino-2,3-dideoxy-glucuronate N-acetyltransferase